MENNNKPGEKINLEYINLISSKKKYIKRFFRWSIISRSNKTLSSKNG